MSSAAQSSAWSRGGAQVLRPDDPVCLPEKLATLDGVSSAGRTEATPWARELLSSRR